MIKSTKTKRKGAKKDKEIMESIKDKVKDTDIYIKGLGVITLR